MKDTKLATAPPEAPARSASVGPSVGLRMKLTTIVRNAIPAHTRRGLRRVLDGVRHTPALLGPAAVGRSDYKATWQCLSLREDDAKTYVAGYTDEAQLEFVGRHTVDLLQRFVGIRPSDVILEIGCGIGRVGRFLAPRCAEWIGADIAPNMLKHTARRLKDLPNIRLIELSTVGLKEIEDESVDVVYCTVVFMHLYEWDRYRYVLEAFRVLRHGGRCFFDNVDITSEHGWKVFMEAFAFDVNNRPAHLAMVSTGGELFTYAQRAGFKEIQVHRWDDAWVGVSGVKP